MNSDTYSYVIDTHTLVWYLSDWQKLGRKAQEIFDKIEKGNAIALIPAIVLAEIVFLAEKKRIRATLENTLSRIDGLVKSPKNREFVIPVKTGIQFFQIVKIKMDSRFRGNDTFYEFIKD